MEEKWKAMATLNLNLPEELDSKLQACAVDQGREVESVVLDILEKELQTTATKSVSKKMPYEEWKKEFDAWIKSRPKIDVVVDDSRETIYEGR
jgi:plasmid stability protein